MIKIITVSIAFGLFLFVGIATVSAQQTVKTPEQVAQSLVDAFNARDLDGILKAYASDSTAYCYPTGK